MRASESFGGSFVIGDLTGRSTGKIFPIRGANEASLAKILGISQNNRVYDTRGLAPTLTAGMGGGGGKTGLFAVAGDDRASQSSSATERCRLLVQDKELRRRRTIRGTSSRKRHRIAQKGKTSGCINWLDCSKRGLVIKEQHSTIDASYGHGLRTNQQRTGVLHSRLPRAVLKPDKEKTRQNGRRCKNENEEMFTLTASDIHGILMELGEPLI